MTASIPLAKEFLKQNGAYKLTAILKVVSAENIDKSPAHWADDVKSDSQSLVVGNVKKGEVFKE